MKCCPRFTIRDDLLNTGKEGTDTIELDEKELGSVSGGSHQIKLEG